MLKTSAGNGPKLPTPEILQMVEGVVEDVTEADEHFMRDACDTSVSPCSTNESAHRYMSIMIASYFTSPTYTTGFIRSERALHIWDFGLIGRNYVSVATATKIVNQRYGKVQIRLGINQISTSILKRKR